jgi:hypothetical protein
MHYETWLRREWLCACALLLHSFLISTKTTVRIHHISVVMCIVDVQLIAPVFDVTLSHQLCDMACLTYHTVEEALLLRI